MCGFAIKVLAGSGHRECCRRIKLQLMAALAQEELRASFYLSIASAQCRLLSNKPLRGKTSLLLLAVIQWSVVLEISNLRLRLQFLLCEVEEEKGRGGAGFQPLILQITLDPHPSKNKADGFPGMLSIRFPKFWISFSFFLEGDFN